MARESRLRVDTIRLTTCLTKAVGLAVAAVALSVNAAQIDIPGPDGSVAFGMSVTVLPNGNIVVTDPFASTSTPNVGAVHLYGPTGVLISSLTGSSASDRVGSDGVVVLSNGNYVVLSPNWDNAAAMDAGAVTWANGDSGLSEVVSVSNSLVGTTTSDLVGSAGVTVLTNGNYVVSSPGWNDGATGNVGAVTWADGGIGLSGAVAPSNSLIGATDSDDVGNSGVTPLSNGNYVVASASWSDGATANVGAVTWGDGTTALSDIVSPANSLVGTAAEDLVGDGGVFALSNGNYVVRSPKWDNGAVADVGAATWGDGSIGTAGAVSLANSLIGASTDDFFFPGAPPGEFYGDGVAALADGNYLVPIPYWNNGPVVDAGAVAWADGNTGTSGVVSAANSLVGTTTNDLVGFDGVTALSNGNYVIRSANWSNGPTFGVGAVTWGNGSAGISGAVSPANSLIGTTLYDSVGRVTALSNGNYVVRSHAWDNGATWNAGAVTWADGSVGLTGEISPSNSLIGTESGDPIGSSGVIALTNGNYVVASYHWDNGAATNAGAVTWVDGSMGFSGVVSSANSLIGTATNDQVGVRVTALSNGNYVVASSSWNNGITAYVGAITWVRGHSAISAVVSPANSVIGETNSDLVGYDGVTAFGDGNFAVGSPFWDNGAFPNAGAITLGRGRVGLHGTISSANSVRGTEAGFGFQLPFGYDAAREQLVVGRLNSNIVSLLTLPSDLVATQSETPDPVAAGNNLAYSIDVHYVSSDQPVPTIIATLTNAIPAGTTFVSFEAPSGWSIETPQVGGTGSVTASHPSLAEGTTETFTLVVNVDSSTPDGAILSNTATVDGLVGDPDTTNNSATATTRVVAESDLSILMSDTPDPVVTGEIITYTIDVANGGPSNATAVTLTDVVPANTTFVAVTAPAGWPTAAPPPGLTGTVTATNATFPAGVTARFTLVVQVDVATPDGTIINNAADVSTTTTDTDATNNAAIATTTVQNLTVSLSVSQTDAPDPVTAGELLTYTLVVNNAGPAAATDVTFSDDVPANTTFVSLTSPAGWTSTTPSVGGAGSVTATHPSLANSASATFTLIVRVVASTPGGTVLSNTATVSSASTELSPADNSHTETTAVNAGAVAVFTDGFE